MSIPSNLPPITPTTFPTSVKPTAPTTPAANTSSASKTGSTNSASNANAAVEADAGDWPDDSALGGNVDTTA